jgi:hypothetical protein
MPTIGGSLLVSTSLLTIRVHLPQQVAARRAIREFRMASLREPNSLDDKRARVSARNHDLGQREFLILIYLLSRLLVAVISTL